jgi:putative tricarboxylic transport membrane protein
MKKYDRVGGLIWTILGILLCIGSVQLRLGNFNKPGPGFIPFLSGAFLILFGLILTLVTFLKESGEEEKTRNEKIWVKENWKRIFYPLFALFGYILLLDHVGFLITTFLFLFFLFKLTVPKRWTMPLILSGGTVILSYLIFSVWLKCQFPKGILNF